MRLHFANDDSSEQQEIGGDEGAAYLSKRLAQKLEANGESIEFLLDEGSFVLKVRKVQPSKPIGLDYMLEMLKPNETSDSTLHSAYTCTVCIRHYFFSKTALK